MKKGIIKTILIGILICIGCLKVRAISIEPRPQLNNLFTICDKNGENCQTIKDRDIENNQQYDLFEIKDREIYLNNAEISLKLLNPISEQYSVHIEGTNKIVYLDNIVEESYIPFTVKGEGTLEIETTKFIKKNELGETYYKCWQKGITEPCDSSIDADMRSNSTNKINTQDIKLMRQTYEKSGEALNSCLTEATISGNTVTFDVPSSGYTISDIKAKFAANEEAFFITDLPYEMALRDFNDKKPVMLVDYINNRPTTVEDRLDLINMLLTGTLSCESHYLLPLMAVYEDAQITASWGNEYIRTELPRRFSKTGSYLINVPEEKEMITTTHKDNITFISSEEFDPNYHLIVDDITEKITEIQSASIQAKTDKVLLELYDINMYDQDDNIVKMENEKNTIKIELDELLKKYKDYQVIYISEENTVELIDAKVEGEYIVFNTTPLGKYGIVGREVKTGNIVNPNTADSLITYGLILASLAVAIALVIVRINKLKKASNN